MCRWPVLISGFEWIGALVVSPRFINHRRDNHTHLSPYTRTVSLHRVISPSHDSRISLRIHLHRCEVFRPFCPRVDYEPLSPGPGHRTPSDFTSIKTTRTCGHLSLALAVGDQNHFILMGCAGTRKQYHTPMDCPEAMASPRSVWLHRQVQSYTGWRPRSGTARCIQSNRL